MSRGASLPVGCQYDRSVVADSMSRWGLLAVEDGMQKALAWLARHDASYLATGFLIPFSMDGQSGVLHLSSTGESTRMCNAASTEFKRTCIITRPHWLWLEVRWYPGVALLNVAGLTRQTGIRLDVFQDFLAEQCAQRECPG